MCLIKVKKNEEVNKRKDTTKNVQKMIDLLGIRQSLFHYPRDTLPTHTVILTKPFMI